MGMRLVIIDNYDSFTYNLSHVVKALGAEVDVVRNDMFDIRSLQDYDKIILSPGPGIPSEAGLLLDVIRAYAPSKPMLGVCLGHQAIGEVFGARIECLSEVYHGVATDCRILRHEPLFHGLPDTITVGRYHSWVVAREGLPECLEITAEAAGGQIMALRHTAYNIHGIQFHPESVLTPDGRTIIDNFLRL